MRRGVIAAAHAVADTVAALGVAAVLLAAMTALGYGARLGWETANPTTVQECTLPPRTGD